MRLALRPLLTALGLSMAVVLVGPPLASAATDVWGNVGPAPQLGSGGLFGRYPLSHYALDQHFEAVSASLTGGVDASGVPPMIAYFLASILWLATSFLANLLITLFSFAFSLDLVNGSQATGGVGALAPVSQAIHSIYANVFGGPWLVLAIAVVGVWAMWKALVQRRYSETAGALGLSLIYVVLALFFVAQPGATIGSASKWTNQMSESFLSISDHGNPSGGRQATDDAANQLFDLLVFKPWVVLDFGGLEHCAASGTGSGDADPESAPVRPLSSSPSRDAALARRLASGTEVSADGKVCINNANKYAPHFLRFSLGADGQDDRSAEYDALNGGDSSKLPNADTAKAGYRLGVADKPASDSMEEGGQYQRLLLALLLFFGELGAILLLGSLSVGIILAQVLLLLLLAFAPVALVAAAIPGRGHAFFRGWLEKLAGYLLRKAAYSLILATLLAVAGALASATAQLGWLMSFGLQSLFFWTVFLQRKTLADSLIGIATGPGAPGREETVRVLALYAGARVGGKALRPIRRGARSAMSAPGRLFGSRAGGGKPSIPPASLAPHFGTGHSASVGPGAPSLDAPAERRRPVDAADDPGKGKNDRSRPASATPDRTSGTAALSVKSADRRSSRSRQQTDGKPKPKGKADGRKPSPGRSDERKPKKAPAQSTPPVRKDGSRDSAASLGDELRAERERVDRKAPTDSPEAQPPAHRKAAPPPRRSPRKGGGR
jgi:hypothetical protein